MIKTGSLLRSPFNDRVWAKKIALGGALHLVPFFSFVSMITTAALLQKVSLMTPLFRVVYLLSTGVFVLSPLLGFFSFGFVISHARRVLAGSGEFLPEWSSWKKLFIDGALYFLIYFLYMLIPLLLLVWSIVFPGAGLISAAVRSSTAVIAFLLGLAACFVIPMAVCNFAARSSLGAAFCFKDISDKIKIAGKDYFSACAISLGLFLAVYVISLFLGVIIIGWILFPFLVFYLKLVMAKMFIELYPKDDPEFVDAESAGPDSLQ
jgi:hypothetical protein